VLSVSYVALSQTAVAEGRLSKKIEGVEVSGEMLQLVNTINSMLDQLSFFADQVKHVAREVGTQGNLGVMAEFGNVNGIWREIMYVLQPTIRRLAHMSTL
jgi:osomolarity two-component system sensor histidine kinase NIK1